MLAFYHCMHIVTTATTQIFQLAHQHSWHAILLTGYRRACLRITDGCYGHGRYPYGPDTPVRGISLPLAAIWDLVQLLCYNPFWMLLMAGCPTPARPLRLTLEFLGPMGVEMSRRDIFKSSRHVNISGPHLQESSLSPLDRW